MIFFAILGIRSGDNVYSLYASMRQLFILLLIDQMFSLIGIRGDIYSSETDGSSCIEDIRCYLFVTCDKLCQFASRTAHYL